jgi:tetratricopeptide (TPR) repeat protein
MGIRLGTLAALIAVLVAVSFFRLGWVPRAADDRYREAYHAWNEGDTEEAFRQLSRAHRLNPGLPEVNMLLGWVHWREGRLEESERHFRTAFERDPEWAEAGDALAMARLALDRPEEAVGPLERAAALRPDDLPIRLRLGEAYRGAGRNRDAVDLYRGLLRRDPPSHEAERALLEMYGLRALDPQAVPEPPSLPDPVAGDPRLRFRTQGDFLQALDEDRWRSVYVTGVNLGPARPGDWAVSSSLEFGTYHRWFGEIAATGANTVRAYTILPPAFYQALGAHNREAVEPLWLIQEVWLDDEARDLWDPATRAAFEQELERAIDVIHGQGDLPCRTGHYCGLFTADVSEWVLGLALGREVEPSLVHRTNAGSPERTSWEGEYVSMPEGHPTEAWFAAMLDLAARYETETYGSQRPLAVVNWPPLDPTHQPTEATQEEEIRIRRALGEEVTETVPEFSNDMNAVSLEMTRYRSEPAFQAGLFALYHVYQHWPDFLFLEPSYAEARDDQGPNRYLGYLLHLKEFYRGMPLLIGEYGVSTSPVPVHLHPQGWHNGGLTEAEQAELLVRFSRNIRDADMAGGIVFAWLDEWWKQVHDEFTAPFEPRENDPLWLNALDPEEYFGLVGYRAFDRVPLLRGDPDDWEGGQLLWGQEGGGDSAGDGDPVAGLGVVDALHVHSDHTWVYFRLDLTPEGQVDWDRTRFLLALNTLPGEAGTTRIPEVDVVLESGANFLIRVGGGEDGRIGVAANYNPWGEITVPGRPDLVRIQARRGLELELGDSPFEDMVIEANRPRYARDGREFPPVPFNRSVLSRGTADPTAPGYSSHATWRLDRERRMVEIRIPWGLLLILDPTNHRAFGGGDAEGRPLAVRTPGIEVSAFVITEGVEGPRMTGALPEPIGGQVGSGTTPVYTWEGWDRVRWRPYFKPAYHALRETWSRWPRFLN